MFKRLFFFSGIIAFVLSCGLMYFWYLPNHSTEDSVITIEEEVGAYSIDSDSLDTTMPLE
ncbi:MAG: hypothetical protein ACJATE_002492 [Bacteroidia bacterium]|jgi:hypothetical protein